MNHDSHFDSGFKTGTTVSRRIAIGTLATVPFLGTPRVSAAQDSAQSTAILAREEGTGGGLISVNPETGETAFSFATDGRPEVVWPSLMPGVAFVQTDRSLALVDANSGETRPISLPESVAIQIRPNLIQFRGSSGTSEQLIGTPASAQDTYLIDLLTGERVNVMGLISADPPPVTLQNVALSADDKTMIVWDGRRTWVINVATKTSTLLGTGQFTFSAGFTSDGSRIAWSQQLADGTTELHIQNAAGTDDELLAESAEILVSLPIPDRNALLLDERTDSGGTLSFKSLLGTGMPRELLTYSGATNIVQFSSNGEFALVGIEGEAGRDWYRLTLDELSGSALLFNELADAEVQPGFTFHSDWAVATLGADEQNDGSVFSVDLVHGTTTVLIDGITSDAAVSVVTVALSGPGALLTIDSFTELAVHLLDLEFGQDTPFNLMKGGSGIISPDGAFCAIAYDLNTGGTTTVVYDSAGTELASIRGTALGWITL